MTTTALDPSLAQAIGFDAADLEANRRGELSPTQLGSVRARHVQMAKQSFVAGVAMLVIVVILAAVGLFSAKGRERWIVLAAFGAVELMIAVATLYARRAKRTLPDPRPHVEEGVARCREQADAAARVDLGGVTFWVFPSLFAALIDGQRYRIYYVQHRSARWLEPISAERLP